MNDGYWYLRAQGMEVDWVPYGAHGEHRKELHRRLRRAMPEIPTRPMPHGRYARYLWDMFPDAFRAPSESAWIDRLRGGGRWIVLGESPNTPVFTLKGLREAVDVPQTDFYFLATDGTEDVLACDHEGLGPWWVPGNAPRLPRARAKEEPSPGLVLSGGVLLDPKEARANLRWLRKALPGYVPSYPLASSGAARDNLWNYMAPASKPASLEPGALVADLCAHAERLLVWAETRPSEAWILPGGPLDWKTWPKLDTYVLEWPQRRWVLAVPAEFLHAKDPWAEPVLVVL